MSESDHNNRRLVFTIRVPTGSILASDVDVLVQGSVDRSRGEPRLRGESFPTEARSAGALGSFAIRWRPKLGTARCWFSAADDGVSDFEFEAAAAPEDARVLNSPDSSWLDLARCLLATAEDFEPSLPPPDILVEHPWMAQIISNQKK